MVPVLKAAYTALDYDDWLVSRGAFSRSLSEPILGSLKRTLHSLRILVYGLSRALSDRLRLRCGAGNASVRLMPMLYYLQETCRSEFCDDTIFEGR
jgi:hypothetical protein